MYLPHRATAQGASRRTSVQPISRSRGGWSGSRRTTSSADASPRSRSEAVGSEVAHNQNDGTPDHGRDRDRQHDAFRRSEVIAFGSPIWCIGGIPCRRLATQQRDKVWICEVNSAGATPLPARPSIRRDGFRVVALLFVLIVRHVVIVSLKVGARASALQAALLTDAGLPDNRSGRGREMCAP